MTAKACAVCEHPDRRVIDRALSLGQAPRGIERRYASLSRRDIQRHRDRCLAAPTGGEG